MIRLLPSLLFLIAVLGKPIALASPSEDDFLFIIAEDQSAFRYRTNVRPNPTSSLDRLALNGTIFRQAYCPASVCNASRTSILACQPPNVTGIFNNGQDSSEIPTVLQHLVDHCYFLRGTGKIFHNHNKQNEVFVAADNTRAEAPTKVEFRKRGPGADLRIGISQVPAMRDNDALRADRAIRWIRNADPGNKIGVLVGLTATHLPFLVPDTRRYIHPYNRLRRSEIPSTGGGLLPEFASDLSPKYLISNRRKKQVVGRYFGCLRYTSDRAAAVIRAFRKKFPDGHVVFISDHGFMLGDRRNWGKSDTQEVACRVPYLVWSSQLPSGQVEGPVSTGTVFPLLLDLCGVPPFPGSFYQSPRAAIEAGQMPPGSSVVTFANRPTWFRTTEGTTVTHDKDGEIFVTGLDDRPIN